MNIVLQDRMTGLFVGPSLWNAAQSDATRFSSGVEAYDYCVNQRLQNMDIVLTFRCPSHDVRVAVRERVHHKR